MTSSKWLLGTGVGLGLAALVAVPVYAHCGKCAGSAKSMIAKMDEAKTTLGKAIELAEKESKGKAVKAECEMGKDALHIDVYCLVGEKLMVVNVDPKAGKVSATMEAKDLDDDPHHAHGDHDGHDHGKGAEKPAEKPKSGGW